MRRAGQCRTHGGGPPQRIQLPLIFHPTPSWSQGHSCPPAAQTQLSQSQNSQLRVGLRRQCPRAANELGEVLELGALTFHPSQMLGGAGGAQFHAQQVGRVHRVSQIQSVGERTRSEGRGPAWSGGSEETSGGSVGPVPWGPTSRGPPCLSPLQMWVCNTGLRTPNSSLL